MFWRRALAKNRNQKKNNNRIYVNNNIRASKVRCINHNDENLGIMLKSQALSIAENEELDLVQVSKYRDGDIPTCKVIDYGKYKYELSKKQRQQAKKQRDSIVKQKEIKFRPTTDIHDLKTKARRVSQFIKDGCRVKVAIYFKGREIQHKHLGPAKLATFLDLIEAATLKFGEEKFEGRIMSIMIEADKSKEKTIQKAS
jgi:translation initiation factor IF-3